MITYHIITLTSITFSIILAVLYIRNNFKYYFFLLAVNDCLGIIIWYFFHSSGQFYWIPINYFLIFSINKDFFNRWKSKIILGFFFILIFNYHSTSTLQQYFVLFVNIILIFLFLRILVRKIVHQDVLDFITIGLILYEVIIIINFTALIKNVNIGIAIYFAGMIAEIIIKIFLIIAKKGVSINIKRINKL